MAQRSPGSFEHFRRTGRLVSLSAEAGVSSLDQLHSGELAEGQGSSRQAPGRSRLRRVLDGLLLFVEVAAVLALVFVLFNGFQVIRNLNQESAEVQKLPTLTPTPLIVAVVLPSGHTPPDASGVTRPNTAEIPNTCSPG
jgi:sortase A